MAKQKVLPYTNTEVAFLLNYADWCLCNNTEYRQTIVSASVKHSNARRDLGSIFDQIKFSLSASSREEPVLDLLNLGTRSLDLETLPLELVEEMNRQREKLGLEQLHSDDCSSTISSSGSITVNQSRESRLRRSKRHNANVDRPTYIEVPDSDEVDHDGDVADGPVDMSFESIAKGVYLTPTRPVRPTMSPLTCSSSSSAPSSPTSSPPASSSTLTRSQSVPTSNLQLPSTLTRAMANKLEALRTMEGKHHLQDLKKRKRRSENESEKPIMKVPALPVIPISTSSDEMSESSIALEHSQPPAAIRGRKRAKPQSAGAQPGLPRSSQPIQSHILEKRVDELFDWVMILAKEYMAAGKTMTSEIEERHTSILRTMQREPGHLTERLLQDLQAADAERAEYAEVLKSLIGHRVPGQPLVFPVKPSRSELNKEWIDFKSGLDKAFGFTYEDFVMPKGWEVGFIAARVEDLLKPVPPPVGPMDCIDEIKEYLESPHTVRTLLGGFLCSQVFATPDPLCQGLYSDKAMYEYKNTLLTEGPDAVQRADKGSAKLMFSDKSGQKRLADLASKLLKSADDMIASAPPSFPGSSAINSPDEWMRSFFSLKQTLMMSPKEYRIHFFLPGTLFDPLSMRAEDDRALEIRDAQAKGKTIVTCLFPALVELDPVPFRDDAKVSDMLVSNKRFFSTLQEKRAFDPKTVVSKAYVLLN